MSVQQKPLDRAEIYDVLRNARRHNVLELLADGAPHDLRSLAEAIAEIESGESPPPRRVRQSVYVTLHQTHLPKLDRLGVVDYDSVSKQVQLATHADEFDQYLDSEIDESGVSWTSLVGVVVLVGLCAASASLLGFPLVSAIAHDVYLSIALFAVLAVLLVHSVS